MTSGDGVVAGASATAESNLTNTLALVQGCHAATDKVRCQFNQAFFERLLAEPDDYWEAKPFLPTDRLGFEWVETGEKVVANRTDNFDVTWQKSEPEAGTPPDIDAAPEDYRSQSGLYFRLHTYTHTNVLAGNTISPPPVKEDGTTAAEDGYWEARPEELRETERYYFSESANVVFATQPSCSFALVGSPSRVSTSAGRK